MEIGLFGIQADEKITLFNHHYNLQTTELRSLGYIREVTFLKVLSSTTIELWLFCKKKDCLTTINGWCQTFQLHWNFGIVQKPYQSSKRPKPWKNMFGTQSRPLCCIVLKYIVQWWKFWGFLLVQSAGSLFSTRLCLLCSYSHFPFQQIFRDDVVWRTVRCTGYSSTLYRCFSFSPTKSRTTRNERVPWACPLACIFHPLQS